MFTAEELNECFELMLSAPAATLRGAYKFEPVLDRFLVMGKEVLAGGTLAVLSKEELKVIEDLRKAKKDADLQGAPAKPTPIAKAVAAAISP